MPAQPDQERLWHEVEAFALEFEPRFQVSEQQATSLALCHVLRLAREQKRRERDLDTLWTMLRAGGRYEKFLDQVVAYENGPPADPKRAAEWERQFGDLRGG
jgi:hypothetical protein